MWENLTNMKKQGYQKLAYILFTALLILLLVICFYLTPFGKQVENKFFDLRTIIKPDSVASNGVVILEQQLTGVIAAVVYSKVVGQFL